jgi:hypothetical protein
MAEFKVMGGVREILVPQFRTDDEMMATLSGHEQNLVRADVLSLPVADAAQLLYNELSPRGYR